MKKNRVLILTLWHPFPSLSGGAKRTLQLRDFFLSKGYYVKTVSALGKKEDYYAKSSRYRGKNKNVFKIIDYLVALTHLPFYFFRIPPLLTTLLCRYYRPKKVEQYLAGADIVVLEFPYLLPWVVDFRGGRIYAAQNVESKSYDNKLIRSLLPRLEQLEVMALDWAQLTLTCNEEDRDWFFNHNQDTQLEILPIDTVVTMDQWTLPRPPQIKGKRVFGFVASQWIHNQEGLEFLKRFAKRESQWLQENNILFLIIGNIKSHSSHENFFFYTGAVPSTSPWLKFCDFALIPLFSGDGQNLKILEYIKSEVPIISTQYGLKGFEFLDESTLVFNTNNLKDCLQEALDKGDEDRSFMVKKSTALIEDYFKTHDEKVTQALERMELPF